MQRLEVSAPPGRPIGWVVQEWSILTPQFRVENAAGECVLRIEGPICTMSICGDVEFKVGATRGVSSWIARELSKEDKFCTVAASLILEVEVSLQFQSDFVHFLLLVGKAALCLHL